MILSDFSKYPFEKRDLTNPNQNAKVLELAEDIYSSFSNILELENELFNDPDFVTQTSPILLEAIKCAASKSQLSQSGKSIHLSVVFAMYNETARLQKKTENIHGEDCLREKIRQLKWLQQGMSDLISWNIIAVDDGCPAKPSSYEVASEIVKSEFYRNVEVLKLESAINNLAICQGFMDLNTTKDSRKGGAITYGLWKTQDIFVPAHKHHVVIYTDADLSSNLAQSGLLIQLECR